MLFKYQFDVRGYELDAFGHVNNAVYLNYYEQARWEIVREIGLYEYFNQSGNFLIVIDSYLKYIKELTLFEKAEVQTHFYKEGFFIVFKQSIYNEQGERINRATIKCLFVDKKRMPLDCPKHLNPYLSHGKL